MTNWNKNTLMIVHIIIFIVSIILWYFTNCLVVALGVDKYGWIINYPWILAYAYILRKLFDTIWWKKKWVRTILDIKKPYLWGDWNWSWISSFNKEEFTITIHIKQTFSNILVKSTSGKSNSYSFVGNLLSKHWDYILIYNYENIPWAKREATMNMHYWTCMLTYKASSNKLEWTYFTSPERGNSGVIELQRSISNEL